MSMRGRWVLWVFAGAAVACGGASASGPAVEASEYQGSEALNPRTADGRPIHLGFGHHHPTCFVFKAGSSGEAARETEELECPQAALHLEECAGGLIYRSKKQQGCVCVRADGGDPQRMTCPP
jgi:hypothetical protein